MDSAAWIKNRFFNSIQSAMLVVSLAAVLGLVGWMLGGQWFALSAVAAMIVLLIFAPGISALLQLELSHTREYNADLGAVELMGNPKALAAALAKIENHGSTFFKRLPWPANPNSQILRTHPPTRERIRRLMAIRNREPELTWNFSPRHQYDTIQPIRIIPHPSFRSQRIMGSYLYGLLTKSF